MLNAPKLDFFSPMSNSLYDCSLFIIMINFPNWLRSNLNFEAETFAYYCLINFTFFCEVRVNPLVFYVLFSEESLKTRVLGSVTPARLHSGKHRT